MQTLLDTNALLRYLLNDIPDQAERVRRAVEEGACTLPEIICECVFVLISPKIYGFGREEVADALEKLLDEISCERTPELVRALDLFATTRLDFVDCIIAATRELDGNEVLTFDEKLGRLMRRMG